MITVNKRPGFLFLFILLFCFSLDVQAPISFYGTQFFGLLMLVFFRFLVYPKISKKTIYLLFFIIIFFEALCFIQGLYIKNDLLFLIYQRVVFLISVGVLLYDYLMRMEEVVLKKTLSYFISFMSLIIIFQFVGFYFLKLDRSLLDFGLILGGVESRTWYFGDWLYRPTGIMSEPAIFIGVQFGLLTVQYLIDKNAFFSRKLGILSLVLSMSFLGLMLAALFSIIVYSRNIRSYVFGGVILLLFYIFSFDMINERIERFVNGEDRSNNVKLEAFDYFISDPNITFFGYGFLFKRDGDPQFYEALLDLTFYLNSLTIFGLLIGSIILFFTFFIILKSNSSIKEKLLIGLSLIKLSNPSVLFFTLFVLICKIVIKKRSYK